MDNKLACDRDVSGNCSVRKTKYQHEGRYVAINELHGTEHFQLLTVLATS